MNSKQRSEGNNQSDDRASEHQGTPDDRAAGAVGGGMPVSPAGKRQSADRKMDDDTGLSNTANRAPSEPDQANRQERQSNVGRRGDGTPD